VDPYCNSGGINSGGQWQTPNCGGSMCHHHLPMLAHGPSMTSLHGSFPPPPLCNPCSSQPQINNFNSVPLPGSSRWGPRTSCPVHSPFRARIPNGTICSGHQVKLRNFSYKTFFSGASTALHNPPSVPFSGSEVEQCTESQPDQDYKRGGDEELYRFSLVLSERMTDHLNGSDDDSTRD
jgi:hypothetical protein